MEYCSLQMCIQSTVGANGLWSIGERTCTFRLLCRVHGQSKAGEKGQVDNLGIQPGSLDLSCGWAERVSEWPARSTGQSERESEVLGDQRWS